MHLLRQNDRRNDCGAKEIGKNRGAGQFILRYLAGEEIGQKGKEERAGDVS